MHRYSRAPDASTSLRAHHQRWSSEPSSKTPAAVAGLSNNKTSSRHSKVAADAGHSKTSRVSGRYQKNRSSTLERDAKTSVASKPSLSSTLQQIGNWARRSFRGHGGGGKEARDRRPKSLNDYVMTEVSSGVVVERRKSEKLSGSRDQSPVTSSGYASGGDGVASRLHDEDLEDGEGHHVGRHIQRGGSRGSRRYRRRASMAAATEALRPTPTPLDQAARLPPPAAAPTTVKKYLDDQLPVYENLLSNGLGHKTESVPLSLTQCHLDTSRNCSRIHPEVDSKRKPITSEVTNTGNISINEYLLPTRCLSFDTSSDASTLRRSGNRSSSPVYVNGNLLMTSLNQTSGWRSGDAARRSRSRSLSSSRNRTLTNGDQSTTFNFAGVQQRLSFTPSFVSQSPPPEPDADWDDRLSTLSLGCRRPPVSPDRRSTAQRPGPRQSRSKSARRRLQFGNQATTSAVDRRPESVEECVRPLFRQAGPPKTISNVAVARNPPAQRSTKLFPGLGEQAESIYETISDHGGRSRLPLSRVLAKGLEVDGEHVYDNIDDFVIPPAPAPTDIHQIPPPLPPPPLPARRPTASEVPLNRSEVVELDSNHVYTIADVLDSFEALAAHLPRAKQFIYDLQTAAYLQERRGQTGDGDCGRRAARDAEGRWTAAAAVNRCSTNQQRTGRSTDEGTWVGQEMDKSSTWRGGPSQRRLRHMYGADDCQPIVVEDYVCSPGNPLSSERPRRPTKTSATATSQVDGLYMPMKPGSKPPASTIFCCGARGTDALDSLPPSNGLTAANAARKPKQRTNRTGKEIGRMSATMSRSITELDRFDDVLGEREGRRTSRLFQKPASFIDASSYMLDDTQPPQPGDIVRHQRALSRSLMDGISHQPSRPTYANVANRKQNNSSMMSSTFTVDTTSRRCSIVPEISPDEAPARHLNCAHRSASEDRQTGTGSGSRVTSPNVGDTHRPKSSRRGCVATAGLSKSLLAASTVQQHPTFSAVSSTSTSVHEVPPQTQIDRRRSSILQWTSASCSGREIFC